MITPTQGALLTIALAAGMLFGATIRVLMVRLAAFAVPPLATVAYLAAQHALLAAYDDTIVYPMSRFAAIQRVPFGAGISLQNLPLALTFPVAGALAAVALAMHGRAVLLVAQWRLCAGLAVAGFLSAWPRPDFAHIGFAAPMALPLLCRGLEGPGPRRWRWAAIAATAVLTVPAAVAYAKLLSKRAGG